MMLLSVLLSGWHAAALSTRSRTTLLSGVLQQQEQQQQQQQQQRQQQTDSETGRMLSQSDTPLINAIQRASQSVRAPFFFPGHKMGEGAPAPLREAVLGGAAGRTAPLRSDLPELPELDNLFSAEGPIHEAQQLASEAFGARSTHFLINGSTGGGFAMHPGLVHDVSETCPIGSTGGILAAA